MLRPFPHVSNHAKVVSLPSPPPTYPQLCRDQPALPPAECPEVQTVHEGRPHQLAGEGVEHRVELSLGVVGDIPLGQEQGDGLGQAYGETLGAGFTSYCQSFHL